MIKLEELTYEQCVVQGIGPMVFPHRLGDERIRGLEDEQRRMQMKAVCVRNIQMQAKMMVVLEKAWSALEEAGIKAVLMKGLGLAQYYPAVEQRQWGDIDLYVGPEQYHPACAVMRETFPKALKFDEELEHYKHYNLIADGVSIEVHRVTMGMMHPRDVRRYARMEQYGMEHAVPIKYINTDKHAYGAININKEEKKNDIKNTDSSVTDSNSIVTAPQSACMQASRQTDDPFRLTDTDAQYLSDDSDKNTKNNTLPIGNVECLQKCVVPPYKNDKNGYELRVPEVTFNALFVMLHSWEHMMHGSANLRQICDLALLLKHEQEKIDRERLKKWLEELRLMDVWQLYMYIAVEMFGVKEEAAPFYNAECAERAEKLLVDILNRNKNIKKQEEKNAHPESVDGFNVPKCNQSQPLTSELAASVTANTPGSTTPNDSSAGCLQKCVVPTSENTKNKKVNRFVRKWGTMQVRRANAEWVAQFSPAYARHMKAAIWLSGLARLFAKDRHWE